MNPLLFVSIVNVGDVVGEIQQLHVLLQHKHREHWFWQKIFREFIYLKALAGSLLQFLAVQNVSQASEVPKLICKSTRDILAGYGGKLRREDGNENELGIVYVWNEICLDTRWFCWEIKAQIAKACLHWQKLHWLCCDVRWYVSIGLLLSSSHAGLRYLELHTFFLGHSA